MKKNKLASLILASVFLMQTIIPSVVKADDMVIKEIPSTISGDSKIEEKKQDNLEEPKVIEEEKSQEVEDNVERPKEEVEKSKKEETPVVKEEKQPKRIIEQSHEEQVQEVQVRQNKIDEAIESNTPLYGYFMSQEESVLVKFFEKRKEQLKQIKNDVNKHSDFNVLPNLKGVVDEEKKNDLFLSYLDGEYDPTKGYENKYTLYDGGFLFPSKNFKLTGLYTKDKPRLVLEVKKGEKLYAPINSEEGIFDKEKRTLELKDGKTKVIITNIEANNYKDIKAGNFIGTAENDKISMYIEKDGKFINPILLVRNKIEEESQGFFGIPQMYQIDKKWGAQPYGSMNISSAACGPSSISMAVSYLTGKLQTPEDLTSVLGGATSPHFINGVGSGFTIFPAAAKHYNLKTDTLGNSVNRVVEELKKGRPVVLSLHSGYFTTGGHFVLATGITKDGKIYVNDPASRLRGEDTYTPEFIASQMQNAFSFYKNEENTYNEEKPKVVNEEKVIACRVITEGEKIEAVEK